jgi:EAL domain-containing protein (putative c-di-GMP-specific phosphodiesterase class I)
MRLDGIDVPVILMTGSATVDSAVEAMELGIVRYLQKPFRLAEVQEAARQAVPVGRLSLMERAKCSERIPDTAQGWRNHFERGEVLAQSLRELWIAYQPIVDLDGKRVVAYEALVRSKHPQMRDAAPVLNAAERLGRLSELGQRVRELAPQPFTTDRTGADRLLFINVNPLDLEDESLYSTDSPLAAMASRVVLELTERASLAGVKASSERIERLRRIGYRIAIDDLGSGYAALSALASLQPDFVKLDMAITREIDSDPTRQNIMAPMIRVIHDLGAEVVGAGVESEAEARTLSRLGCDYLQGYFFARPRAAFPDVYWP